MKTPTTEKKNTRTKELARDRNANQGMNWITQKKRLAIYLRDGLCCAYCGRPLEAMSGKESLSLDHIKPYSKGGSNHESNLVCCCSHCNSSRQDKPLRTFAKEIAGEAFNIVEQRVRTCSKRNLKPFLKLAGDLIDLRGSCKKALEAGIKFED